MLEQERLREQFQALLDQEQQALAVYTELADKVRDPRLRDQVEELRRDKQRHVELTERLLEIVD
jgi:rubrerythrin